MERDWYLIAEQPAPAPQLARPEGRAALRTCANYCAPCQPLWRAFPGRIRARGGGAEKIGKASVVSAVERKGNDFRNLNYFTRKPGPDSGPDCLVRAEFAR